MTTRRTAPGAGSRESHPCDTPRKVLLVSRHQCSAALGENPETLKAEILTSRGVGRRVPSDSSTLDTAALAQVSHRERDSDALPEAEMHVT